jgi:predicted DNA-binding protein (MmcQ/YjbR family)
VNVDEVRSYCMSFPEATENLQWGDDLCFKIRGKIFTTLALTTVPPKLCFKCTPEMFAELIERENIHPAPYVGRYKWVLLDGLDVLGRDELKELIRQSYEMVVANAPKASRQNAPKKKSKRQSRTSVKKKARHKR